MASKKPVTVRDRDYVEVFDDVAALLVASRTAAARTVNTLMTSTYWLIGRRIFEGQQKGRGRADYGDQLIERGELFGRGRGRPAVDHQHQRILFLRREPRRIGQHAISFKMLLGEDDDSHKLEPDLGTRAASVRLPPLRPRRGPAPRPGRHARAAR